VSRSLEDLPNDYAPNPIPGRPLLLTEESEENLNRRQQR
jgi:hypothetical protein